MEPDQGKLGSQAGKFSGDKTFFHEAVPSLLFFSVGCRTQGVTGLPHATPLYTRRPQHSLSLCETQIIC